jgi:hypothetical protein
MKSERVLGCLYIAVSVNLSTRSGEGHSEAVPFTNDMLNPTKHANLNQSVARCCTTDLKGESLAVS